MKIEFRHPLPAMNIEGRHNGTYNNEELGMPGVLTTTDARLGEFLHKLRNIIFDDRRLVFIGDRILVCSKNWIRDHVHEMKAFLHWEYNLTSFLDFIIDTQRADGQYYELVKQMDDFHWKMVDEDCRILYPEDNQSLVRLELEADVEYLVVEGAADAFRVSGDLGWLARVLPKLEAGIAYCLSDPKRFDAAHGLVKRPFSIDTWDFRYDPDDPGRNQHDRRITDDTPMSVMHGDNTGVYAAMRTLADFNRRLGNPGRAEEWEARAATLRENIFKYLYNGRFFIHQLHLGHPGFDNLESERLSLSNAYALNRGILTVGERQRIVEAYIEKGKESGYFAEWFTIYPPYEPSFMLHDAGEYVNGAVSPFTAGELAKGAFSCGYEEYAWDIIRRFIGMSERDGTLYFLYSPVDCTPQNSMGPSAWGAAALLSAVDEGLAGITDADTGYRRLGFSPRFPVTPYTELRYITGYEKTGAKVDVRYILTDEGMRYDIVSPAETVDAHILLPAGKHPSAVFVDGAPIGFRTETLRKSLYVDFEMPSSRRISVEILF